MVKKERETSSMNPKASETKNPNSPEIFIAGGSGIETWTFVGLQKGIYQLIFKYVNISQGNIKKTEKIKIVIN